MSSRVQAHRGPLPNEPTSQGWITATSITVEQLWARNCCPPLSEKRRQQPRRIVLRLFGPDTWASYPDDEVARGVRRAVLPIKELP